MVGNVRIHVNDFDIIGMMMHVHDESMHPVPSHNSVSLHEDRG